jgi:hypothetical protein
MSAPLLHQASSYDNSSTTLVLKGGIGARLLAALARHAFDFAAGMLVPIQIEVTWAAVRLFVAATGNAALAASLPETAFDNVLLATSISDLWGRRWHQFFVSSQPLV